MIGGFNRVGFKPVCVYAIESSSRQKEKKTNETTKKKKKKEKRKEKKKKRKDSNNHLFRATWKHSIRGPIASSANLSRKSRWRSWKHAPSYKPWFRSISVPSTADPLLALSRWMEACLSRSVGKWSTPRKINSEACPLLACYWTLEVAVNLSPLLSPLPLSNRDQIAILRPFPIATRELTNLLRRERRVNGLRVFSY